MIYNFDTFRFMTLILTYVIQVYLGEQYVNNPTLSDVTFLVEGRLLFFVLFQTTYDLLLFH